MKKVTAAVKPPRAKAKRAEAVKWEEWRPPASSADRQQLTDDDLESFGPTLAEMYGGDVAIGVVDHLIAQCYWERHSGLLRRYLRSGGPLTPKLIDFIVDILDQRIKLKPGRPDPARRVTPKRARDMVAFYVWWIQQADAGPLASLQRNLATLGVAAFPVEKAEVNHAARLLAVQALRLKSVDELRELSANRTRSVQKKVREK